MDQDVLSAIEIDRPRSEVADYVSNPENASAWYENIKKVEWKSPKPLSAGSEIAFEAEFMEQTLDYTYQVTEYVPGESLVMSSTYGRRIHDANIVATMLVYGIPRLRTNNPEDFVRFATLIEVLPLVPPAAPPPPPEV